MMENAFYFIFKALLVLQIFEFLSWIFGHVKKRLDKKDKVNFKIEMKRDNETMKRGQLIKYNMLNIFLEKLYTKCGIEILFSEPF